MARMHSGAKGKSRSKKPLDKSVPTWVTYKPKEVEMLIVKLAKSGMSSSRIGAALRDTYGIPSVRSILGKTVVAVLKEKDMATQLPEDVLALIRRSIAIRKHLDANKMDKTARRGLALTESKINRLVKYYKENGVMDRDWKFNPESAALFLE